VPFADARLLLILLLVTLTVPFPLAMPPPSMSDSLFMMVQLVTFVVPPAFRMPPPPPRSLLPKLMVIPENATVPVVVTLKMRKSSAELRNTVRCSAPGPGC
jgi:hypothetical protein